MHDDKWRELVRTRIEQACVDDLDDEQLAAIDDALAGRLRSHCSGRPLPWLLRERIYGLHDQGWAIRRIASTVGLSTSTVHKYLVARSNKSLEVAR